MSIAFEYVLQRNVGTVGRPPKACAVCNFSPTGHLLVARLGMELLPEQRQRPVQRARARLGQPGSPH
jgi:hypothetical protein